MARVRVPQAVGAERYIITCCLNDQGTIIELSNLLRPEDFYSELYKHTFQVCVALLEREMVPEPMTVYNFLEKLGIAEPAHLKELELLQKASYSLANLNEYVEEIRGASARRQLIDAQRESAKELIENAHPLTPEESVSLCEERILEVGNKLSRVTDVCKIGENTLEVLHNRAANPVLVPGLPTGFSKLDEEIQGLQGGRLYVLLGRFKTGKSIFLMNIAAHVAINCGIPVLMIDTENPSAHIEDRFTSLLSGVDETSIRNGMFAKIPGAPEKVEAAVQTLKNAQIYHHYMPNFTFEAALSLIRRYKVQKGIGLVIFDYIKSPDNSSFSAVQEHQLLGYLTTNLKNKVAGALNIPVVTAAQLGRKAIGATEEQDDHVADSDRIGRYANCLIYLREKSEGEKEKFGSSKHSGNMVMTVHINRDGPCKQNAYDVWFDKPIMSMKEVRARKL